MLIMPKLATVALCCVISLPVFSQQSDFISFKKKGRTITNYFKGMPINFIHTNGSLISGTIKQIRNDTVFLVFNDVRMVPNYWGAVSPDTLGKYDIRFHYKEIAAIPKPFKGLGVIRKGKAFIIGGIVYASVHTVNGLIRKERINPTVIAISGAVALAGYGLGKTIRTKYPIGKKYTIQYTKMTPE